MTYRGKVINGAVVVEDGASLPEGATVRIRVLSVADNEQDDGSLSAELLSLSGSCSNLPSDLARNHDHYLYGTPRQ